MPSRRLFYQKIVQIMQGVYQKCYFNVAVEGVSKCDFAMSRDVACRTGVPKKI